MKRSTRIILLFLNILLLSMCMVFAESDIVYETGFEDDTWVPLPQNWSLDTENYHSGQRSLHINVSDPQQYTFPSYVIPCEDEGEEYILSFNVKTENVVDHGLDPYAHLGATACIQYFSKDGEWLGGKYDISGFLGTNDWTGITSSFTMPDTLIGEVGYATLVLYLRQGLTGKAWFDDVRIVKKPKSILHCRLFSPKYRTSHTGSSITAEILTKINLPFEDELSPSWFLTVELQELGKKEVLQKHKFCDLQKEKLLTCVFNNIAENVPYELTIFLKDDESQESIEHRKFNFINISQNMKPKATLLDEKGNLIVNGEPFFPLGWYVAGSADSLKPCFMKLKAASFNAVMNYYNFAGTLNDIRRWLDLASSYDIKVLFTLKDFFPDLSYNPGQVGPFEGEEDIVKGLVSMFKDHPAILGWYIVDELEGRIPEIELHNKWVWELDYWHPTWLATNRVHELKEYDAAVDILGVWRYPVPEAPLTQVSDRVNAAQLAQSGNKPVWAVIQTHGSIYYGGTGREPTIPEIKAMSYLALINGAKGLLYYSYFDMEKSPHYQERWKAMGDLNKEILELVPVFLHGERVKLHELVEGFEGALFEKSHEKYLIVVNHTDQEREFLLDLNEPVGSLTSVREKGSGRKLNVDGNILRDTFDPFAVHIYIINI